ncbi:MAG: Rpn family recombination-promoting nuclease/putative transposase [Haliscomenobacter sp.]|uniref:Rpn family recombination-promoting nuclease/putative transposase n=1 Tax=Haliscomenobacter sp. TaxID=2717303 RepID=UPI0029BC7269|nr:Rpn family recombination-promoting nuclease/putative transposase [Haliscomenobacter sp.]MDX2070986.1 Rpn family recombination-promoting nuclease/putative transposase [Haliscomenobacter sp.]
MSDDKKLVRFDWFVKFMLRDKSNFEILEGFLSELLKEDIRIIEILDGESNKKTKTDKFNRVDILVRDHKDERIIVEIQNNKEYDYLQRILFGAAKTLTENIDEGNPYSKIKKIISVSVVYFEAGQGIDYIYHGQTIFTGVHKKDILQLTDDQQELYGKKFPQDLYPDYYLIKAEDFDENIKDTLDEWVYFFKKGQIKETFTAKGLVKAKKKLNVAKLTPAQRREYERYLDEQRSIASHNETVQKDLEDAKKEAKEEGKEEGKYEGRYEVAVNLLRSGSTVDFTIQITGLPEEVVLEIKRKLKYEV